MVITVICFEAPNILSWKLLSGESVSAIFKTHGQFL